MAGWADRFKFKPWTPPPFNPAQFGSSWGPGGETYSTGQAFGTTGNLGKSFGSNGWGQGWNRNFGSNPRGGGLSQGPTMQGQDFAKTNPNWTYDSNGDPITVTDQHGNPTRSPFSKGAFNAPNFMGFNANGQPMWSGHSSGKASPPPDPFAMFNNNIMATLRNLRPQLAKNQAQAKLFGSQLGTISDKLNAPPAIPAIPSQPGLSGTTPIGNPNYVSSDRLNQGKGWSKFRNQAMGTPEFDQINKLFHQERAVGPQTLQGLFQSQPGYQKTLQQAQQFGMSPEEFLKKYL